MQQQYGTVVGTSSANLMDPAEINFDFERPHRFVDMENNNSIVAEPERGGHAAIDAGAYGEVAEICRLLGNDPLAQQAIAQAAVYNANLNELDMRYAESDQSLSVVHDALGAISELLARSLPEAWGTNVVNVILVDFRAFDTLGEITVLGIVGLTVYALLRRFRPAQETIEPTEQQRAPVEATGADLIDSDGDGDHHVPPYLEVPAVLVRLLLPVAGLFAFHLFMRGHNEPGGGFVAGLVVAIAFIAQYMVSGTRWVEERMHLLPPRWIAFGLLVALATGAGALWLDHPFLTTHTAHVHWPLVGEVHLPTAALFDLGVFAVVVGSTLLMLTALAHQSLRAQRRQAADVEGIS